jgi:hypothetical protein
LGGPTGAVELDSFCSGRYVDNFPVSSGAIVSFADVAAIEGSPVIVVFFGADVDVELGSRTISTMAERTSTSYLEVVISCSIASGRTLDENVLVDRLAFTTRASSVPRRASARAM